MKKTILILIYALFLVTVAYFSYQAGTMAGIVWEEAGEEY